MSQTAADTEANAPLDRDRDASSSNAGAPDREGSAGAPGEGVGGGEPAEATRQVPSGSSARAPSEKNSKNLGGDGSPEFVSASEAQVWNEAYERARRGGDGPQAATSFADDALRVYRDEAAGARVGTGPVLAPGVSADVLARDASRAGVRKLGDHVAVTAAMIPPMLPDFALDEVTIVARSGVHRIAYTVPAGSELDFEELAVGMRHVLWGMRHGMKLPDPTEPVAGRPQVCLACGARPHFQDHRLADPRIEAVVAEAEQSLPPASAPSAVA